LAKLYLELIRSYETCLELITWVEMLCGGGEVPFDFFFSVTIEVLAVTLASLADEINSLLLQLLLLLVMLRLLSFPLSIASACTPVETESLFAGPANDETIFEIFVPSTGILTFSNLVVCSGLVLKPEPCRLGISTFSLESEDLDFKEFEGDNLFLSFDDFVYFLLGPDDVSTANVLGGLSFGLVSSLTLGGDEPTPVEVTVFVVRLMSESHTFLLS
jgi:hypothetical protein